MRLRLLGLPVPRSRLAVKLGTFVVVVLGNMAVDMQNKISVYFIAVFMLLFPGRRECGGSTKSEVFYVF